MKQSDVFLFMSTRAIEFVRIGELLTELVKMYELHEIAGENYKPNQGTANHIHEMLSELEKLDIGRFNLSFPVILLPGLKIVADILAGTPLGNDARARLEKFR